jgi:hypothetical protein
MKSVLNFLLQDWRRKLVALLIAFGLWWWIDSRIAIDREIILTVVSTTENIGTPNENELLIQAPQGWVLTDPMIGQPIAIWLKGSKSELQSFSTRQCAASLKVGFSAQEDQVSVNIPVSPLQLDWLRPNDAQLLLKDVAEDKNFLKTLTFQRVKSESMTLSPRDIEIVGEPSDAWMVVKEELRFEPNVINLIGPQRAMTRLRNKMEDVQNDTAGSSSELLSAFEIPDGTRGNVHRVQTLNKYWQRQGIRMEPAQVHVFAPVRLESPVSIQLNFTFEDLHIMPMANPGTWVKGSWEPQPWVVEMPDVEDNDEIIDDAWIHEHVVLVLPLNTLDDALDPERKVRIEAHIHGLETAEKQRFYAEHLIIRPLAPGNDLIPYSRVP